MQKDDNIKHVLGLSGGKDSAALAMFMRDHHPELNIEYFYTDTGKELPEVYDYLNKLEGYLGKEIIKLNPRKDFDYWFKKEYGYFLPSAQQRWCTIMLKLKPFEEWIKPALDDGYKVKSYIAIRADENRLGYKPSNPAIEAIFPFVEHQVDKAGVFQIIDDSGLGLPKYYEWRSRSGCTFCFFQQKIEWVRLREKHPKAFKEAIEYEKLSASAGYDFTWVAGEPLEELEKPQRIQQIKDDYEKRLERAKKRKRPNPLLVGADDIEIDEVYGSDPGLSVCVTCHK